ncbi:DUF3489 domain-containing protein [Pinisolibacter sp.]|uniref:DUF3489 domain-containing protein n=1 Tax=Pinisolibacter sp. TaxID=2172024 RepID=UPI002FDDEBF3
MPRHARINPTGSEVEPNQVTAEIDDVEAPAGPQAGPDPEPVPPTASPKLPIGKLGVIFDEIAAPAGATIDELAGATGWQPHTIRAAFSRLRRRGFPIVLATDADGRKAYRRMPKEG